MFVEESKGRVAQETCCCLSGQIPVCETLFARSSKLFWHHELFHREMEKLHDQILLSHQSHAFKLWIPRTTVQPISATSAHLLDTVKL
jgi:hypothetical protein